MKKILIIISIFLYLFFCSCFRTKTQDIRNCVIIKQHCGFDNFDGGYYQIKDLKTGVIRRVDVDIRDCNVYQEGDIIR